LKNKITLFDEIATTQCSVKFKFAIIVVDFGGYQGERPQEYHWYFKGFQRRETAKDAARIAKI